MTYKIPSPPLPPLETPNPPVLAYRSDPKIDKHIPPPKRLSYRVLDRLGVSDSVFISASKEKHNAVRVSSLQRGKRKGVKFTCRATVEDGIEGVRIWRIE